MSHCNASVLLVEDDKTLALIVGRALTDHGYLLCGPARTVGEAFRVLDECEADAAVVDYKLADSTSARLMALLEERKIPICVVTGTHRDELPSSYLKHPFLAKPFGVAQLIEEVERLLHTK